MLSENSFSSDKDKDVSVVIPVYNSAQGIQVTLDALLRQEYPKQNFEIIVVDNRSTDTTPKVVEEYVQREDGLVRLCFQNETQGSYAARNVGIKHAHGRIIAFVDADMWMDQDWLTKIVAEMDDSGAEYLGCRVKVALTSTSIASLYDRLTGFPMGEYISKSHFAGAGCLVVKPILFDRIGLFDASLLSGGDREFGNRAYRSGVVLHYAPDIILFHPARTTITALTQKKIRTAQGLAYLVNKYPAEMQPFERYWFHLFLPPNLVALRKKSMSPDIPHEQKPNLPKLIGLFFLMWYLKVVGTLAYLHHKRHLGSS